ncbi:MAG TPA: hypothetical protein VK548_01510 [Candidatus Acidoferrum sp.]|nr:hypothetical protein [Candidatus Acidoferrum sp.]
MTRSTTRWMLLGLAFVLTLVGITPMVYAHGGDPTLVHSCVNKSSGEVRIVGASASCKNNETAVDWPATAAPPPPPAGGGSIMVHGVSAGVVATFFVHFGGGVPEYRLPRDGTVQNMRILVTSNSYNAPTTVTFFVNGAATVLSAVIPPASTADIDVVGAVPVLDGQKVSVMADASTVSSGSIALSVSYEIQ